MRITVRTALLVAASASAAALAAPPASATSTPPGTSTCTYNNTTQSVSNTDALPVAGGDVIHITCTGLVASHTHAIVEVSPLGIIDAANGASYADGATAVIASADASGNLSASYTIPSTFTAGDPNAVCPPTQAEVDAGLAHCILVIADLSAGNVQANVAQLLYSNDPTPQTPTLSPSSTSALAGDTLTVTGTQWWGSAFGAPYSTLGLPAPTVLVGGAPAINTVTISPTTYNFSTKVLTPAALSGTITVPAGGDNSGITVLEPNVTADPGNGTGNTVMANAAFTYRTTSVIATKTTAGFKHGHVVGNVRAAGKGVAGLTVVLEIKSHGKWRKVVTLSTHSGGAYKSARLHQSGRYDVVTAKQSHGGKTYGGSTSNTVKVHA